MHTNYALSGNYHRKFGSNVRKIINYCVLYQLHVAAGSNTLPQIRLNFKSKYKFQMRCHCWNFITGAFGVGDTSQL